MLLLHSLVLVQLLNIAASENCWISAICDGSPSWLNLSDRMSARTCTSSSTSDDVIQKKIVHLERQAEALELKYEDIRSRIIKLSQNSQITTVQHTTTPPASTTTERTCTFYDDKYCYEFVGNGKKQTQKNFQDECERMQGGRFADFEKIKDLKKLGEYITSTKKENCTPCYLLMKSSATSVGNVLKWGYSIIFTTSDSYEGDYALCQRIKHI